jgi:hypothetical protein
MENKVAVWCNEMLTYGTFVAFFFAIPHHNYHYNINVPAKDPLQIIKNINGNKKKI